MSGEEKMYNLILSTTLSY